MAAPWGAKGQYHCTAVILWLWLSLHLPPQSAKQLLTHQCQLSALINHYHFMIVFMHSARGIHYYYCCCFLFYSFNFPEKIFKLFFNSVFLLTTLFISTVQSNYNSWHWWQSHGYESESRIHYQVVGMMVIMKYVEITK